MSSKDNILKTAMNLFATNGYENVGVQKIVESVGIKKPTLYHHFGSKKGLLESIIDFYFTPFLNSLKSNYKYSGNISKNLEDICLSHFDFVKESGVFYRLLLSLSLSSENSEARKTVFPFMERQFKIFNNLFLEAANDHGNMKGRNHRYALTFIGMMNSYISHYYYGHLELDKDICKDGCHQFMHGIFS